MTLLKPDDSLVLYMSGALLDISAKMGFGVMRYSPNHIACVIDPDHAGKDAGVLTGIDRVVPIVATLEDALSLGGTVLVLGIAPPGGLIPKDWYEEIDRAVSLGMSVINGLHDRLAWRYPAIAEGQWIWDIRVEPDGLGPGTGEARHLNNRRALMIGTDMAIGKMTAGLEIYHLALEQGIDAKFVATGQIGVTIIGSGIPLDAIRVDFATGAVEREVLRYPSAQLVIVEGQGSLVHPGSSSTLPLLRGAMPTHLVLCHRAGQTHLRRRPEVAIPPLDSLLDLYQEVATVGGIFPRPKIAGICLNTAEIESDKEALEECDSLASRLEIPVVDPVRFGPSLVLEALMD